MYLVNLNCKASGLHGTSPQAQRIWALNCSSNNHVQNTTVRRQLGKCPENLENLKPRTSKYIKPRKPTEKHSSNYLQSNRPKQQTKYNKGVVLVDNMQNPPSQKEPIFFFGSQSFAMF